MDITTEIITEITTSEPSFVGDLIKTPEEESIAINFHNISLINVSHQIENASLFVRPVFESFIVAEIIMTALELAIALIAVFKISGWRGNYRNQMLMQISAARFIKRIFIYIRYLNDKGVISSSLQLQVTIISSQIYIDYVISILICFFMKHMYDSLLIVIVKISRGNFYRVLTCSWLVPVPVTAMWTSIIVTGMLDKWSSYFFVCCIFRWPLMFLSTILYIIILYRVLKDDIRKFARGLTIVTFFLCFIVNCYLLFKDVIELWCLKSFTTILVSYVLGFCLNALILCLYMILIVMNYHSNRKQSSYAERSNANVID